MNHSPSFFAFTTSLLSPHVLCIIILSELIFAARTVWFNSYGIITMDRYQTRMNTVHNEIAWELQKFFLLYIKLMESYKLFSSKNNLYIISFKNIYKAGKKLISEEFCFRSLFSFINFTSLYFKLKNRKFAICILSLQF